MSHLTKVCNGDLGKHVVVRLNWQMLDTANFDVDVLKCIARTPYSLIQQVQINFLQIWSGNQSCTGYWHLLHYLLNKLLIPLCIAN